MTDIRKSAVCALVVSLCLWLQGCSTAKTKISETERLSNQILSLAMQDKPLELHEVAQTLQVRLSDYEDINSWALSGWTYMLHRKSPETRPINSIWLSEPTAQHPRQVLWVVFDPSTCLSLEAMGQRVGQSVVQRYFPGFADVRGGWLTLLEWEGQSTSSELMAPLGCSRRFQIYKTQRK
jgi:hypothetical protein